MSHVILWFLPTVLLLMFIHVFLGLFFFQLFLLSFIFLSPSPLVPSHSSPPNVTAPPAAQDIGGLGSWGGGGGGPTFLTRSPSNPDSNTVREVHS